MRLNTVSNQFIFNLPMNFVNPDIANEYQPLLRKNFVQYENVIDYLNSTIKGVNLPGLGLNMPSQRQIYGKETWQRPATNVNDIITSHDLIVKFRSVDSDLNYFILYDIFINSYQANVGVYIEDFILVCLDNRRDAIYNIYFHETNFLSMDGNELDYSHQRANPKEFTVTFRFNYYKLEYLLATKSYDPKTGTNI